MSGLIVDAGGVVTKAAPGSGRRPASAAPRLDRIGEVLGLVRSGQARTMAELAAAMGVARSTVAPRVDRLLEHGLLRANDDNSGLRGRPPTMLAFNPAAGVILVAHLGMTGAQVAATDLAGEVLADSTVTAPIGLGPEAILDRLDAAFADILSRTHQKKNAVRGIGIALPSAVELSTAPVPDNAEPHSWDHYPIADRLTTRYGVPTLIDHDVNLLALGEQQACWPDAEVFLCLKVGTVIGCGIVIAGRAVAGAQGLSGEIGHTQVPGDTTPCLCGNVGCLDAVASGAALVKQLADQGLPAAHARDVARLARQGALPAVQAVRTAGRHIGEVLATSINLLNPHAIAVWGYLTDAEEPLFAGMRESIYEHALPGATRTLQLAPSRLGDNAGVRGAAIMVIEHLLHPDTIDKHLATTTA